MNECTNGLCVDVDDTIADTAITLATLVGERFGFPEHRSAHILMKTDDQPGNVDEWKTPQIQEFVARTLNDPSFLRSIPVLGDSAQYLSQIEMIVPIACYITSREDRHLDVTTQWLDAHGFPKAPVVLRPVQERRVDWKCRYLHEHFTDTLGYIDNDRKSCVSSSLYRGKVFWFDRYQTGALLSGTIVTISSWKDMSAWIDRNCD